MPSIHEILLEVTGSTQDARRELAAVARDVAGFDGLKGSATLDVDAGKLEAKLALIRAELAKLDNTPHDIELGIRTDLAIAALHGLERELDTFKAKSAEGALLGGAGGVDRAQQSAIVAKAKALAGELEGIQKTSQQRITEIERDAESKRTAIAKDAAAQKARNLIEIPLDERSVATALGELDRIEQRLKEVFSTSHTTPELQIKTARALTELELVRRKVNDVVSSAGGSGRVRGDIFSGLLGSVNSVVGGAEKVSKELETLTASGATAAQEIGQLGNAFGGAGGPLGAFAGKSRDVQEGATSIGIIIIGALIPAIVALGASFGAAIAGAGALATAFAAALGPAVLLLVGLFERFSKILAARKALQQQDVKASNDAADAAKRAAAAEQARADAARTLRDARQNEVTAERALGNARDQAAQSIKDAAEAERQAAEHTADAIRTVGETEKAVTAARLDAKRAIAAAQTKEADAERSLNRARQDAAAQDKQATEAVAKAQQDLQSAVRAAYREWANAIQAVKDDQLSLADATLSLADAQLALEQAQINVNDELAKTPALAQQVQEVFKKLNEVDFGPSAFDSLVQQIGSIGGGGAAAQSKSVLDLRKQLLDLAHAKLAVEQASNAQAKAEKTLADDQKTANGFAKDGINASDTYKSALEALVKAQQDLAASQRASARSIGDAARAEKAAAADLSALRKQGVEQSPGVQSALNREAAARRAVGDAQRAQATAQDKLAKLQSQGVAGTEAVISAEERLRNAHEAVATAQAKLKTAGSDAFAKLPADVAKADNALGKLDATERGFLDTLNAAIKSFESLVKPATDIIFKALTQAFDLVQPLIAGLGGIFDGIAGQWASAITRGAHSLVGPAWSSSLAVIFADSERLAGPLLNGLGSILEILRNIALATLPALVDIVHSAANGLGSIADKTSDIGKLRGGIEPLVESFKKWVALFGGVIDLLAALIGVAGPAGNGIVDWLTKGAHALADWMRSEDGRKRIQKFFDDTIPLAKSIASLVLQVGLAFFQAFQTVAPTLTTVFNVLGQIFGVVNQVFAAFNAVAAPVLAVKDLLSAPTWFVFKLVLDAIVLAIGAVALGIGFLEGVVKDVFNWLTKPFADALAFIKRLFGIASPARAFLDIGRAIVEGFVLGLAGLVSGVTEPFRKLLTAIIGVVSSIASRARNLGRDIVNALGDAAVSGKDRVVHTFESIAGAVTGIFSKIGGAIAGAFKGVLNVIVDAVNGLVSGVDFVIGAINAIPNVSTPFGNIGIPDIPKIPKIPRLAAGGLATHPTFAQIGDAGREAVLPLTQSVFSELAVALADQLRATSARPVGGRIIPGGVGAGDSAAPGNGKVEQHFHIPPSPSGRQPDARTTASLLAREMRARTG